MSKIYTLYGILPILLFLLGIPFLSNATEITSSEATPVKIVDGDSMEIGNHRIRLIGIDAPEYFQYCKDKNKKRYDCGKKATSYLKKLIADKPVKCVVHNKDKYDRNLCTCYAEQTNLNAQMVYAGHAVIYLDTFYIKEQQDAKENKRGIWQGKFIQPRLFRRLQEQKK